MVLLLYTKSKHVWYCYCSANSVVLDFLLQNLLRKKKRKRKNKFTVGITCLLSFRFLSIGLIYWSRCREGERRRQFGKERIQFPLFVSAAAFFFFWEELALCFLLVQCTCVVLLHLSLLYCLQICVALIYLAN
jgi:hypothetical protein